MGGKQKNFTLPGWQGVDETKTPAWRWASINAVSALNAPVVNNRATPSKHRSGVAFSRAACGIRTRFQVMWTNHVRASRSSASLLWWLSTQESILDDVRLRLHHARDRAGYPVEQGGILVDHRYEDRIKVLLRNGTQHSIRPTGEMPFTCRHNGVQPSTVAIRALETF